MLLIQLISALVLALTAFAQPHKVGDPFEIHIHNKCHTTRHVGIYGVTPSFQMVQHGHTAAIAPGGSHVLRAPFHGKGLRLSAHADAGLAGQWKPMLLFEFGYTEYAGKTGTSYDISMMHNAHSKIGMEVHPIPNGRGSGSCESKKCVPGNCPASQGWTSPGQSSLGSPADTSCYHGKTNFKVIYCPDA